MQAASSKRLYTAASVAAALSALVFAVGYAITLTPPLDALGFPIGHDFVNVWMGAHAALSGYPAALFDFPHYQTMLRDAFGPLPPHNWSYPPHLFLFIWPLGFLPYLWALAVWCAVGLAFYLFAATRGGADWREILFLVVSPAVVMNLYAGQNGFFTSALIIGGLTLLDRRPALAGLLFGLLTLKPQLGVLVPVMLAVSGRWRVFAAAAASAVALFLATGWIFGFAIWPDYVRVVLSVETAIMNVDGGVAPAMMPTIFISARMIGASVVAAYTAQLAVSLTALAAVVWAYGRPRDPVLSEALLVTAVFLATPYAFSYDMPVLAWAILQLRRRGDENPWDAALNVAVWILPLAMIPFALHNVAGAPLVLLAFAGRLIWRLAAQGPSGAARVGRDFACGRP
jgi:hypothetical protein